MNCREISEKIVSYKKSLAELRALIEAREVKQAMEKKKEFSNLSFEVGQAKFLLKFSEFKEIGSYKPDDKAALYRIKFGIGNEVFVQSMNYDPKENKSEYQIRSVNFDNNVGNLNPSTDTLDLMLPFDVSDDGELFYAYTNNLYFFKNGEAQLKGWSNDIIRGVIICGGDIFLRTDRNIYKQTEQRHRRIINESDKKIMFFDELDEDRLVVGRDAGGTDTLVQVVDRNGERIWSYQLSKTRILGIMADRKHLVVEHNIDDPSRGRFRHRKRIVDIETGIMSDEDFPLWVQGTASFGEYDIMWGNESVWAYSAKTGQSMEIFNGKDIDWVDVSKDGKIAVSTMNDGIFLLGVPEKD